MSFDTQEVYFFGDSLYLLTDSDTTWGEAQNEAISLGGNLATINNAQESAFLSGLLGGKNVWIGLNDSAKEDNYTWISNEPVTYTNWDDRQPSNSAGIENFVALNTHGRWDDRRGDGRGGINYQGIVEITNPTTPTIHIEDLDVIEPSEGTKEAVLKVRVLGTLSNPLLLSYSTSDGTALANSDYTPTAGTLTFNPSPEALQTQEIRIPIRGDGDEITGENFGVTLNQPTDGILARSQGKITIRERSEVKPFGDSAYVVTSTEGKWGDVRLEALRLGGDLVTINNPQEQAFVSGLVGGTPKWMGLTDVGVEGTFEWVNGTSAYTNWADRQPSNSAGIEHYVAINTGSRWDDRRGDGRGGVNYQGIAEIPLSSI